MNAVMVEWLSPSPWASCKADEWLVLTGDPFPCALVTYLGIVIFHFKFFFFPFQKIWKSISTGLKNGNSIFAIDFVQYEKNKFCLHKVCVQKIGPANMEWQCGSS